MFDPPFYRACADPECGKLFEVQADQPRRLYCSDPACKERRQKRNNQEKMARVKKLKESGKWYDHLQKMAGTGRGRKAAAVPKQDEPPLVRKCLKCDLHFQVPEFSDDHICGKCHIENDELLAEFSEEALDLIPIPPRSSVSNGGFLKDWGG